MIYIDKAKGIPLYKQIYSSIVKEIMSGAFAAGYRLPAMRKLAQELSVGRNTVEKAYQQLEAEGYISAKAGSGFTVSCIPIWNKNSRKSTQEKEKGSEKMLKEKGPDYNFAYGSMSNNMFPYKQWRKCANDVLTELELGDNQHYPARLGEPKLQTEIAEYLKRSRDVNCKPEKILITPGQQHSMEILSNLFDENSRKVIMEEPGYDGIRKIFEKNNYEVISIDVGRDGIDCQQLINSDANLVYLTPSHQFPMGSVLPISERRMILEWAEKTGAYIVEDDYDSELRYYTNPIPSMQSLDSCERTVYTGTFSKSLSPTMRVSYMILPEPLMEKYMERYGRYNAFVSTFHQLVLAEFMKRGYYEQHINRLRTAYRKKQAALFEVMAEVFGDKVKLIGEGAGIHLLMDVETDLSQEELVARAETIGARLYTTRVLYNDESKCPENRLLIGFPIVPTEAFGKIAEDLKSVWEL